MSKITKRQIDNLKCYLSQIKALSDLGLLNQQVGKSLNSLIKQNNLYHSHYRMIELTSHWKKYGLETESFLRAKLKLLEQEEQETKDLIRKAMENLKYLKNSGIGRLPDFKLLVGEECLRSKSPYFRSMLSEHIRELVATFSTLANLNLESEEGMQILEKLREHFSGNHSERITKDLVRQKIESLGYSLPPAKLTEVWRMLKPLKQVRNVNILCSLREQEHAAMVEIATALNVRKSAAVSMILRGVFHLMANRSINAIDFLEYSKKLEPIELEIVTKMFSKVSIT